MFPPLNSQFTHSRQNTQCFSIIYLSVPESPHRPSLCDHGLLDLRVDVRASRTTTTRLSILMHVVCVLVNRFVLPVDICVFPFLLAIDTYAVLKESCGVGGWQTCSARSVLSDLKGLDIFDERSMETAVMAPRYHADEQGEPDYATHTPNCCRYRKGALCFGLSVVLPLWSSLPSFFPTLFTSSV